MWKLYLLLKEVFDSGTEEIFDIIEKASPEALLECIYILYDNSIEFTNAFEFNSLLIKGITQNDFFGFVGFIRGLDGSSR